MWRRKTAACRHLQRRDEGVPICAYVYLPVHRIECINPQAHLKYSKPEKPSTLNSHLIHGHSQVLSIYPDSIVILPEDLEDLDGVRVQLLKRFGLELPSVPKYARLLCLRVNDIEAIRKTSYNTLDNFLPTVISETTSATSLFAFAATFAGPGIGASPRGQEVGHGQAEGVSDASHEQDAVTVGEEGLDHGERLTGKAKANARLKAHYARLKAPDN